MHCPYKLYWNTLNQTMATDKNTREESETAIRKSCNFENKKLFGGNKKNL